MCRLLVYKGSPVIISKVTHQPEHSLMKQSKDGGVPGLDTFRNVRVNGDGFGIAWYNLGKIANGSCVFKCITPAWNNHNLKNIVKHIESYLIFGHIRAVHRAYTFSDHRNEISEDNCHPFVYKRYTFMHNGGISGFAKLKRSIREGLPDHLYNEITGTTDSEHLFAMLLQEIGDCDRELSIVEMGNAVENTINKVTRLANKHGVTNGCSMNIIFSDGRHVVATRCRTTVDDENPSLFYCQGFGCYNNDPEVENAICISSEPMTRDPKWTMLPKNHMILVPHIPEDPTLVRDVTIRPLNLVKVAKPGHIEEVILDQLKVVQIAEAPIDSSLGDLPLPPIVQSSRSISAAEMVDVEAAAAAAIAEAYPTSTVDSLNRPESLDGFGVQPLPIST